MDNREGYNPNSLLLLSSTFRIATGAKTSPHNITPTVWLTHERGTIRIFIGVALFH